MRRVGRLRFLLELGPDLVETGKALHRTFRGDPERARLVLGIVCEHAWRMEFEHHTKQAERDKYSGL